MKQACNFQLILLDIPSGLILSVKNSGDVFLLSNNLFLKKAFILLQKTVTEYSYNSNITATKKLKLR